MSYTTRKHLITHSVKACTALLAVTILLLGPTPDSAAQVKRKIKSGEPSPLAKLNPTPVIPGAYIYKVTLPAARGDVGACCTSDGSCYTLNDMYDCWENYGGEWYSGETCTGDGGSFDCPPLGACCVEGECYTVTQEDCEYGYDGTWYLGEICTDDGGSFDCPVVPSACCTDAGECYTLNDANDCYEVYGGEWYYGEVCTGDGGDFDCPLPGGSACCTSYGCEMAEDEYECLYMYDGVYYPGERCVDAGGDFECPGACCTENFACQSGLTEELCALLYPNGAWYPGQLCVEAGGDFVCPDNVNGACCTDWGCWNATEEECHTSTPDALWLEGEDCINEPCPPVQGACCYQGECVTTDEETCLVIAGPACWYRGEDCPDVGGDFVCTQPDDESLFIQYPESGSEGMWMIGSDTNFDSNQHLYERFWSLNGDVCGLRWFGFPFDGNWNTCDTIDGFIIRIFAIGEDSKPGAQIFVTQIPIEEVSWTWRPEHSEQFIPLTLAEFEVQFDDCLPIREGYVSIIGQGVGECKFWFCKSYEAHYPSFEGDGAFCMDNTNTGMKCGRLPIDLPIEIVGPEILGACCDDVAGTCTYVMPDECLTGRFVPGVACAELDPPCGALAGACCSETEPCYLTYEADCTGVYAGDGTTCDPIDCNSNTRNDACDIALGYSSDCNGNGVPDECDIASGLSDDYDADGLPDECDSDRNANGVPDACDISCATGDCINHPLGCGGSNDCQGDGVPDDAQLGTLGDAVIWDNGAPLFMSIDPWQLGLGISQQGGLMENSFTLDDFVLPEGGARINQVEFYTETSSDFVWTGRVHLKVHANAAFWSPVGAEWQVDADPNDAVVDLWIPDDGGAVERLSDGPGYDYDRYKWIITGIDIPLEAGPWFIGFALEGADTEGISYSCCSTAALNDLVRSEAWLRPELSRKYMALDVPEPTSAWGGVDLAFKLITDVYGQDENSNGIPDDCEVGCPNPGASGAYCVADIFNGNCVVDLADLAALLSNYGMTSGASREDGDIHPAGGDGAVNLADLAELLSQYGDDCN